MNKAGSLPLEGVRVVDFTTSWAGPVCTMMLADMGAEVIKIENPAQPDAGRNFPPFAEEEPGMNRSGFFEFFNRGKKGCLLNLKEPEGVEIVKQLVKLSDIVVENFSPRVMDSLGLGYYTLKKIKPDIIMVSLSGYGATGPDRDCLAYGQVVEAYAGLNSLIGYPDSPPLGCGPTITDHTSGTQGAFAALAALHYRDLTGEGQHIDISEVESLLPCIPEAIMEFSMNGRLPLPKGNRDDTMAPHGCYRCQGDDEWVAIAVESETEWKNLCQVMGRPELTNDERFQDLFCRLQHLDELDDIINEWTSRQTAMDIMQQLQQVGIAAAPVYGGGGIYTDPHLRAREFIVEINHPEVGKREIPGVFARLAKTPGAVRRHSPLLGEHTDWVLHELLAAQFDQGGA